MIISTVRRECAFYYGRRQPFVFRTLTTRKIHDLQKSILLVVDDVTAKSTTDLPINKRWIFGGNFQEQHHVRNNVISSSSISRCGIRPNFLTKNMNMNMNMMGKAEVAIAVSDNYVTSSIFHPRRRRRHPNNILLSISSIKNRVSRRLSLTTSANRMITTTTTGDNKKEPQEIRAPSPDPSSSIKDVQAVAASTTTTTTTTTTTQSTPNNATVEVKETKAGPSPPLIPIVVVVTREILPGLCHEFYEWKKEVDTIMIKLDTGAKIKHFESEPIIDTGTFDNDNDTSSSSSSSNESSSSLSTSISNEDTNRVIYVTIVATFPSIDKLNIWKQSVERKEWLDRADRGKFHKLVSKTHIKLDEDDLLYNYMKQSSSSSSSLTSTIPPPPAKWKMAIVIASAIYPTALLVQSFLLPTMIHPLLPSLVSQSTAIKVCVSITLTIPIMSCVALPIMMKTLGPYVLQPLPPLTLASSSSTDNKDGNTTTTFHNWKRSASAVNWYVVGITYLSMIEVGLIATGEIGFIQDLLLQYM